MDRHGLTFNEPIRAVFGLCCLALVTACDAGAPLAGSPSQAAGGVGPALVGGNAVGGASGTLPASGGDAPAACSPPEARAVRLTTAQYRRSLAAVAVVPELDFPLASDPTDAYRFDNDNELLSVTPLLF